MNPIEVCDVAIVGAGIAGLSARRLLVQQGLRVLTLEKSRGVGGRIASRRARGEILDFGAQCFTQNQPRWRDALSALAPVIQSVPSPNNSSESRYTLKTGMRDLAQCLADSCAIEHAPIEFENRVIRFESTPEPRRWKLECESGREVYASALILTPPMPQTVALLDASELSSSPVTQELRSVTYRICLAVLIAFERRLIESHSGFAFTPNENFDGIYDQRTKGLPGRQNWVTFHLSESASQAWLDRPEQEVVDFTIAEAKKIFGNSIASEPGVAPALHRWRYSEPHQRLPGTHRMIVKNDLSVLIAGDTFQDGGIESAFRSGHQAANALLQDQNSSLNSTRVR